MYHLEPATVDVQDRKQSVWRPFWIVVAAGLLAALTARGEPAGADSFNPAWPPVPQARQCVPVPPPTLPPHFDRQPIPPLPARQEELLENLQLGLRARQAMLLDPALAKLNIGVKVQARAAILWGCVPAEPLVRQACAKVEAVPGILQVRSELRVETPDDPINEFLRQPCTRKGPALVEKVRATYRAQAVFTSLLSSAGPAGLDVMPAIVIPPPDEATARVYAELPGAVEQLCKADSRFKGIQPRVDAGVVHLEGTVTRLAPVYELARAVARLPGVQRVLIECAEQVQSPGKAR